VQPVIHPAAAALFRRNADRALLPLSTGEHGASIRFALVLRHLEPHRPRTRAGCTDSARPFLFEALITRQLSPDARAAPPFLFSGR